MSKRSRMVADATTPPTRALARSASRTDVWLFITFLVLLSVNAYRYWPFFADDSLISLRYVQRFIEGKGLNWTDGAPVEGYTNFLWIIGVSLLGKLGIDLILAARILGVACVAATAAFILRTPIAGTDREREVGKLAAVSLFAMSATTAVWAIGGLEQPLLGACLAAAVAGALAFVQPDSPRGKLAPAIGMSLALLCLTRPDSPVFVMAIAAAFVMNDRFAKRKVDWRSIAWVVAIPLSAYVAQTLFRHFYYGDWVPNTARVKFKPSPDHLAAGIRYLYLGFLAMFPLFLAAALSVWRLIVRRRTGALLVLIIPSALWVMYLLTIGGDIFPTFRHFTPLVVLSAFAVALGFGDLLSSLPKQLGLAPVAAFAGSLWLCQFASGDVRRAEFERFEWQGRDLALALKAGFADKHPTMAVTAAGCLPYWSEFDCIDMLGLNDAYIPRHPPKSFGTGLIGHELGNSAYILRRRPDLIVYNIGTVGDSFLTGKELAVNPEFLRDYAPVSFWVNGKPDFDSVIWLNRHSPKIGYVRSAERLTVPGYLANAGHFGCYVKGDGEGHLRTEVLPGRETSLVIAKDDLPAMPYRIELVGDGQGALKSRILRDGALEVRVRSGNLQTYWLKSIEVIHHD